MHDPLLLGIAAFNVLILALQFVDTPKLRMKISADHNRFQFATTQDAVQHGPERECVCCRLLVNRYVPDSMGLRFKCVNCLAEGK